MKKILLALFLVLVTSSLALSADTLPKPEALSEETIFLTEKISANYDTLVIKDFSAEGAEYSRVNDEEKAEIIKMMPLLMNNIADALTAELKSKGIFKNIVRNSTPTGRQIILEGKISEFNAGSKAMKMFVGFGAGKAYLKFKGRFVDASGKELAIFEDRETGYLGSMSLMSYDELFPYQARSIGENLARFLIKLY
ncbi:MAG: DUF4410 domain-containing protein [Steroidobacteraceae bacterium]|nr:DUF4410 domain-containing protein [Deltaproteobacteria bacterium]